MNDWYVRGSDGEVRGSYSGSQLVDFAMQGRLDSDTMVCSASVTNNQWVSVKRLPKIAKAMQSFLDEQSQKAQIASIQHLAQKDSYATGAATTMMIGGVISIVTAILHVGLGFFICVTFVTAPLIFVLGVSEIISANMAGKVSVREFRSRAQLIGILEMCSSLVGNCLMLPLGLMTLASLPPDTHR